MEIRIPQVSPRAGYLLHADELAAVLANVLREGSYVLGKEVSRFESEFAGFVGLRNAVGVANGTDALTLALKALGIGRGDLVATVAHTAVATVAAIEMAGAHPILIDIDLDSYCMDPQALAEALSFHNTGTRAPIRAVVSVHLYGQAADMASIAEVARSFELKIVEDCSQAHGAKFQGRSVGTFGDVATFSFYPTKNLGAFGDGGLVATDNAELSRYILSARQYGWDDERVSLFPGANSRLDEMQAAVLRVKLRYLDSKNRRREEIASMYDRLLAGLNLDLPQRRSGDTHVFHQYVVRVNDRDRIRSRLREEGIGSSVHYPVPVHQQPAYAGRIPIGPARLDRTERAAESVLSLPMFPELTDDEVAIVCETLARVLS